MNEELKKYVNAFMDGEDVQYRLPRDRSRDRWYYVQGLSYFEDNTEFRIEPKVEDKWQRVIDEGYLCKLWDSNKEDFITSKITKDSFKNGHFIAVDDYHIAPWNNCEVLREKGIKQPYFQGDDIPEILEEAVIYFRDGSVAMCLSDLDKRTVDWSEVVAYIEV